MITCAQLPRELLVVLLLLLTSFVHAQTACPPGMVPYGAGVCGYDQSSDAPAQSPPSAWRSYWLSIATDNVNFRLGTASNMPDANSAQQVALSDCRSHGGTQCKVDLTERNGCAAIVAGIGGYNVQSGNAVVDAVQKGMAVCTKAGNTNCHSTYSICSLPQRIQ